jgi:cytochrome c5
MVADIIAATPAESIDQTLVLEMEAVETANSAGAEAMESIGDVHETVKGDVSENAAAAAGAAGTKLAGETPAETPGSADPVMADTIGATQDAMADVDLEQGNKIYTGKCFACHAAGVAGAPKLGDTADWAPRITKGMEVMTANAINGFQGARGYMPAKGGFTSLTDAEVTAAVAYMASESH